MTALRFKNTHQEIQEIRTRLLLCTGVSYSFSSVKSIVDSRLNSLQNLIGTDAGDELHRYVIVGSVAALETFHRGTIVSIVDSGDEYKARASQIISEKFLLTEALNWLSGSTVTFGEFIAHNAPCNSTTDLVYWLSKLLDCDTKISLAKVISPADRRTEFPDLIVDNVDSLLASLAETFRLRHIFAHEAAPSVNVNADKCRELHKSIVVWVSAIDALLWATIYKDFPYNQAEMNQFAYSEVLKARKELATAMKKALSNARASEGSTWLRKNHFAWKDATMDWSRQTYGSLEGTLWPAVYGADLAKAIRTRTEQILDWNKWQSGDTIPI
ncbi:MAG: hypothetical protein HQL84_12970 [Magnetococcales bacterium]|nr:hypothetical protein [Magnetococcales bacterium]MBF0150945.1 hypothetical protein [Magnetococcales bacterium]